MKKLSRCILLILCLIIGLSACKEKAQTLEPYLSELRSSSFYGQSQNYQVKAGYGFKEISPNNDGKVLEKEYSLTFKLLGKETDNATYTLSFSFLDKQYSDTFKLNPVTHSLTAKINVDGFNLNEFTVQISSASSTESVTLKSTVPDGTMSYLSALEALEKNQKELIDSYKDKNGNFIGEICARVVVKDDKAYWYIGLTDKNGDLKALLLDGVSGEVLAIREVF